MKKFELKNLIKEEIKKLLKEEDAISPKFNYLSLFFANHAPVQDELRRILGDDIYNKLSNLIEKSDNRIYKSINANTLDGKILTGLDNLDKKYKIKDTTYKVMDYIIEYAKLINDKALLDAAETCLETIKDNEEII
jgi:hypothetical protein